MIEVLLPNIVANIGDAKPLLQIKFLFFDQKTFLSVKLKGESPKFFAFSFSLSA
jgi:hypothetical protein